MRRIDLSSIACCLAFVNRELSTRDVLFDEKDFAKNRCRSTHQGYKQAVRRNRICVHLAMIFKLRCVEAIDIGSPSRRSLRVRTGPCQFSHAAGITPPRLRPTLAIADKVRDPVVRSSSRSPERRVSFDRASQGDPAPVEKTLELCGCGERWCEVCHVCYYRIDRDVQWAQYNNGNDIETPPDSPLPQDLSLIHI